MAGRVAVVGNGIAGLSIAFALKRLDPAVEVLLYGPDDRAAHNSGSAAAPAMINVFGEVTEALYESPNGRHLLEIGMAASERWPSFLAALGEAQPLRRRNPTVLHAGTYIIPNVSRDGDRRNIAAIRQALLDYEVEFEAIDDLSRVPNHRFSENYGPGLYIPSEKFLDARLLLAEFDHALAAMPGVRVICRHVRRVDPDPPAVVDDNNEREGVDAIVLANSHGFSELVAPLAISGLPHVIPVFGAALRLPFETARPATVRTPIFGSSCGDYAVYFRDHVYVGATSLAAANRVEITAHLQRNLDFFDPGRSLTGCSLVGGARAMSQDTYPLIGRLGGNLFAAVGFMRSGITLAPYVADLVAREALGLSHAYENRFKPVRSIKDPSPSRGALVSSILEELRGSLSSMGQRRSADRYGWLMRLLISLQVSRIVRALDDVPYNSDIVQLCYSDPTYIATLKAAGKSRPVRPPGFLRSTAKSHLAPPGLRLRRSVKLW